MSDYRNSMAISPETDCDNMTYATVRAWGLTVGWIGHTPGSDQWCAYDGEVSYGRFHGSSLDKEAAAYLLLSPFLERLAGRLGLDWRATKDIILDAAKDADLIAQDA